MVVASLRWFVAVSLCLVAAATARAQEPTDGDMVATWRKRVAAGGEFWPQQWRRGADGRLEVAFFADSGEPRLARFQPLVRGGLADPRLRDSLGAIGWLALLCHGSGDLLAMTDAEFHLRSVGVDLQNEELRRFVVLPSDSPGGAAARAGRLDRMVAIDLLRRRGVRAALGELQAVAGDGQLPPSLRARAAAAARALQGEPPRARARLDPAVAALPPAFDVAVVVDHALLPELDWLTGAGRRVAAATVTGVFEQVGGALNPGILNNAQCNVDVVGEAPFDLCLTSGNLRLDQSLLLVSMRADEKLPFAVRWLAAGEFEADILMPAATKWCAELASGPLPGARIEIAADGAEFSSDGARGRPRPEAAAELLRDSGTAIRVVVPPASKVLTLATAAGMPPAAGAELRVSFGADGVFEGRIDARDEDGAEAWVAKLRGLVQQVLGRIPPHARVAAGNSAIARPLIQAVLDAEYAVEGREAVVRVRFAGVDRQGLEAMVVEGTR